MSSSDKRCYWDVALGAEPPHASLRCEFTEAFPLGRRMQLLFQAAAELSSILLREQVSCFIGVGPLDDQDMYSDQWEIVIIPENENEQRPVAQTVLAFANHLNVTPLHHELQATPPSRVTKRTDPTLN